MLDKLADLILMLLLLPFVIVQKIVELLRRPQ